MKLSRPIQRLRREAKMRARAAGMPLHAALDQVAGEEGVPRWSLLVARSAGQSAARRVLDGLAPGDLVLIGARPGQGKTLLALEIAVEAARAGREATFFTLDFSQKDLAGRFVALGIDPATLGGRFSFDASDTICADHVARSLAGAPRGSVAVIDYLQILDQRRDRPDLGTQLRRLKEFAARRGVILIFVSQIDRSYDPAARPLPSWEDVRMPNPFDLGLFDKGVFLNAGEMRVEGVG